MVHTVLVLDKYLIIILVVIFDKDKYLIAMEFDIRIEVGSQLLDNFHVRRCVVITIFSVYSIILGIIEKLEEEMAHAFSTKSFEVAGDILAKMKYYQTILDNVAAKFNKD